MGIMKFTSTIMKNLINKPVTKNYPIEEFKPKDITRGNIAIEITNCILCGICDKKCPTGAIEVNRTEKYWSIDRLKCIQCNCCVESCPKKCLEMKNMYTKPTTQKYIDLYKK